MIRAEHITKSFDGRVVLDDISIEFETGTDQPDHRAQRFGQDRAAEDAGGTPRTRFGRRVVRRHELHAVWISRERRAIRKDIGMIFQGGALLDSSTVEENVKLPLDLFTSQSEKEKMERVDFCLAARAAGRRQPPLSRRVVGRNDQTRGHCPRHRAQPALPVLRRAQLGPRPADLDRHRQPDPRNHARVQHHHRSSIRTI